jgi:hypothetical protein
MDEQRAVRDGRVAAAAEAWLADPLDIGVYGRLVGAVRDRRAYLDATLDPSDADPSPDPSPDPDDERHAVQPLGAWIAGADPREILDRLRGAKPRGR